MPMAIQKRAVVGQIILIITTFHIGLATFQWTRLSLFPYRRITTTASSHQHDGKRRSNFLLSNFSFLKTNKARSGSGGAEFSSSSIGSTSSIWDVSQISSSAVAGNGREDSESVSPFCVVVDSIPLDTNLTVQHSPTSGTNNAPLPIEESQPSEDNNTTTDQAVQNVEDDDESNSVAVPSAKKRSTWTLHSYTDPVNNTLYHALNTPKSKFGLWIEYQTGRTFQPKYVTTRDLASTEESNRSWLRTLWKQGRLISDRTEMLAIYASDGNKSDAKAPSTSSSNNRKRGGFHDYLHLYVHRYLGILAEQREVVEKKDDIRRWLEVEYGLENVNRLLPHYFLKQTEEDQFKILQCFLDWFRDHFPYYYDRCDTCGVSVKENPPPNNEHTHETTTTTTTTPPPQKDTSPFLGYVYPTSHEIHPGKASRTEIYHCPYCKSYTRFPRYNAVSQVLKKRKGRCGEYSMLLYQFFSSLGFQDRIRWVVDWSDHVWVELCLNDRFVHLDPCEAAVNRPLLYQEWGKTQTFIMAFRPPPSIFDSTAAATDDYNFTDISSNCGVSAIPLIEDVTKSYTSDSWEDIWKRREESSFDVISIVKELEEFLKQKIIDQVDTTTTTNKSSNSVTVSK